MNIHDTKLCEELYDLLVRAKKISIKIFDECSGDGDEQLAEAASYIHTMARAGEKQLYVAMCASGNTTC